MKEVKFLRGTNTTVDFQATKKSTVKPEIKKEYRQDGVRMYKTTDGRTFIANKFDATFNQGVKLKVKAKNYKPKSLDTRVIY